MASDATILVIGTFDTKSDELAYLREQIESQGAAAICMDVSVLGDAAIPVEINKHEVASAAGSSIAEAAAAGDENSAMQIMARGASALSSQLHADGRIDAMVALGGTMGTDLALDCARVLPTGVPKVIVSTVAFSPLIPADRLAADIAKDSVTRTRQDLFYPELSAVVETSHEKNLDGTIGQRNEQVAKVELTFPFNLGMTAFDSVDASRSSFKATIDRAADTLSSEGWASFQDPWFPELNGGAALFRAYPHLPHQVLALASVATGSDPWQLLSLGVFLGVLLLPLCFYTGARTLGLSQSTAALSALAAVTFRCMDPYGHDLFGYGPDGKGLFGQLWGMNLAALALPAALAAVLPGGGGLRRWSPWARALLAAGVDLQGLDALPAKVARLSVNF